LLNSIPATTKGVTPAAKEDSGEPVASGSDDLEELTGERRLKLDRGNEATCVWTKV